MAKNELNGPLQSGPWDSEALKQLNEWDQQGSSAFLAFSTNPWETGILPVKTIELIGLAFQVACTTLNADGVRRQVRRALDVGATREEILVVFKMGALLAIHTCSLGAPLLLESAKEAGIEFVPKEGVSTPACDKMKEIGQWNDAWNGFYTLDPGWTDELMMLAGDVFGSAGPIPPKEVEFLSIAFDASITHMYAPGTKRHIVSALALGASIEEIMEVLKVCVIQGAQSCNLGVPILAEELKKPRGRGKG